MIANFLKQLRNKKKMTLSDLDKKIKYWIWNISNYENWKIKPENRTILMILTKWYWMNSDSAWDLIHEWRTKELDQMIISQKNDSYNN